MGPGPEPIGVILAGGAGRRIGGSKATVLLRGKPLIRYPLEALAAAVKDVVVVAKPDTELPSLPGVMLWLEPATPQHPLAGILYALGMAGERAVLVCAVDLPFVSAALLSRLARTDPAGAPAVVAAHRGSTQPLLGCYQPDCAELLPAVAEELSLREAVASIGPLLLEVGDGQELFNVNAPEDLLHATAVLDRAGIDYPNVKS